MSIEAEQSVIGALLMNNDAIDRIGDLLPEHFYRFEHQQIFSEIRAQISAGKQADVITVGIALGEKVPDAIAYLNAMSNSTPSSAGITRYAAIVINESVMRSLAALSNEIGEIIEANKESAVCVDLVAAKLEKLAQKRTQSEPRRLSDMLSNYVETIEKRMNGSIKPIATGYSDLDRKLGGGLERGTLCVIAGRPAMGKTALGLGIARNVSKWGSSLFLSMEMSETQVNDRNVGALGKIPMSFLRDPGCKTDGIDYWPNLTAAFKKAQEMNLFIDDQTGLNMIQIRAKARKVKRTHGLDLIVVDQLSFITGALSDKSWESTGEYTRALIQIAKELDVAVILLCQLNRECEKRTDKRPLMADLAQSGSIEQDATNVILLYRDEVYNPETREKGIAEINIAKQRQGSPGVIGLVYIGDQTRFEDLSRPWERSEPVQQRSKKGLAELL